MSKNLIERYIWLLDTVRRYGRISRRELDSRWADSRFGDGQRGLARRTLFNYRQGIEELLGVRIACDPKTFEYYIDQDPDAPSDPLADWVLNSAATSSALQGARDLSQRIMLENVPSARENLSPIIEAIRANHPVQFDYHSYARSHPNHAVVIEPYFLRIFRQLWYLTGRNVADGKVKTYALDRISSLAILTDTFTPPDDLDPKEYFHDSYGITVNSSKPRSVRLRADANRAKYLRALPLHSTQQEEVHDHYSIFTLSLRLTDDFVAELLSMGPSVTVLAPAELRKAITESLAKSLDNYDQ